MISNKDYPTIADKDAQRAGHIGFRTPTDEQRVSEMRYRFLWQNEHSTDYGLSLYAGYRKHAFVLRQIAVMRATGVPLNDDQAARYISQQYID